MQSDSEMEAIVEVAVTSMQSFPIRFTGQERLHSRPHFRGLQRSPETIAILVSFSSPLVGAALVVPAPRFPTGISRPRYFTYTRENRTPTFADGTQTTALYLFAPCRFRDQHPTRSGGLRTLPVRGRQPPVTFKSEHLTKSTVNERRLKCMGKVCSMDEKGHRTYEKHRKAP
jgi:hypothetical protein